MYVDLVTQNLVLNNGFDDVLVILRTMAKRLQLKDIKLLTVAIDKGACDPADIETKLICGEEALQTLINWAIQEGSTKSKEEVTILDNPHKILSTGDTPSSPELVPTDYSKFRQDPPALVVSGNDLNKGNNDTRPIENNTA